MLVQSWNAVFDLKTEWSVSAVHSINRTVGPSGPFFPSCIPGTLLNSATYAQALSQVATLKGKYLCRTTY